MRFRAKQNNCLLLPTMDKRGFEPYEILAGWEIELNSEDFEPLTPEQPESGECEHEEGGKEEHDHLGTYHVGSETCCKCGAHMLDWEKPAEDTKVANSVSELVDEIALSFNAIRVNGNQWAFKDDYLTQSKKIENYTIAKVLKAFDNKLTNLTQQVREEEQKRLFKLDVIDASVNWDGEKIVDFYCQYDDDIFGLGTIQEQFEEVLLDEKKTKGFYHIRLYCSHFEGQMSFPETGQWDIRPGYEVEHSYIDYSGDFIEEALRKEV